MDRFPLGHSIQCLIMSNPNPEISGFFQKGFSLITNETVGRELHALCLKCWTEPSVFHANTLIGMYSKYGDIKYAEHVFDRMPERNEASWNNMISGYVKVGLHKGALEIFLDMLDEGFESNSHNVASLLTAFARSGRMFLEGVQVHGLVLKNGLMSNVFVGTSLLHFYGGFGRVGGARMIFEEMPERNVVSWTSLMVNLGDEGMCREVADLYQKMMREGVSCNQNTFTTVISSCGALGDEFLVNQVLGHVTKMGLDRNVSVSNSLISVLGSFGRVDSSLFIFNHMEEHDTISWNSMLASFARNGLSEDTLKHFRLMRLNHQNIVDENTLSIVLSACDSIDVLKWGRGIHGLVLKSGYEFDICICNTLLTMYFNTGEYEDAENLFHQMPAKDQVSWNSMMAGYVLGGKCSDALRILCKLLSMGNINFVTFTSALSACANARFLHEGMLVHALIIVSGLHESMVVCNALLTMYSKCATPQEAMKVFHGMPEKELVTWNALIGGLSENEQVDEALKAFKLMREEGIPANYITLINILGSCNDPSNLVNHGMPLHAHILSSGHESDEYVRNSLISMYADCGDLDASNYIFLSLVHKTPSAWNSIIAASSRHGQYEDSLRLILEMQRAEVDFDQYSLSAALSASANLAILGYGQHIHGLAVKLGLHDYDFVSNAAMDMYGKCGELTDLLKLVQDPKARSILSWNILISAFSRHGFFKKAQETFHKMVKHGAKPTHVTFVSLLSACSHAGLVDEGLQYFDSMTKDFGVPHAIEHCVCMVDLLGRSGKLLEAESFIEAMQVPPNSFIWRSLLSSCKIHGDLELAQKALDRLLEENPSDDSAYVLYSNACATSGKWHEVFGLRGKMGSENVRKKPAHSWVDLRNKVTTFFAGDRSHEEFDRIFEKLMELKKMVREVGYVADTSCAMQDTDEEDREDKLWMHSERLALAYGLISTSEGSTIRVFKNLRVCADCHAVYKLASEVVGREIVLRDPFRFHHFSGGKCSCNDYW